MSRNRTIKPEFCKSKTLNSISLESNLFFILLWTHCDDFGTILNSNRYLIGQCFPSRLSVSEKDIDKWKNELIDKKLLVPVNYNNNELLIVRCWEEHQKVPNPSVRNNIDMNLEIPEIKAKIQELITDKLESNEGLITDKLESKSPMSMSMSMSKIKSKGIIPPVPDELPSEESLTEIFFEELKKKCEKLNLNYPDDIDKLKADEKCLVYIEYCHKYYGTKKQYKDYNGAARTFLNEVSKLRNYKKPEAEVMSFSNIDDVISKICQSVDNCKPGNIHNYIKHKDQVGMFENWTLEQIYRHGCKVATYPDNQWQKEKKAMKVNLEGKKEIDKLLEGV